jgi:hypothetical protein
MGVGGRGGGIGMGGGEAEKSKGSAFSGITGNSGHDTNLGDRGEGNESEFLFKIMRIRFKSREI